MKIATAVSLIIITLLAACADIPQATGGLPLAQSTPAGPNAAAWNAAGTQTAVHYAETARAASYNATAQSAGQMAEQTAVSIQTTQESSRAATAAVIGAYNDLAIELTREAAAVDIGIRQAQATATVEALRLNTEKQENMAEFWREFRSVGSFLLAFIVTSVTVTAVWRWWHSPDFIEDADGNPVAHRKNFKPLPQARKTVINQTSQPKPQQQPVYMSNGRQTQLKANLPGINSTERANINMWLVAVLNGTADLNRTSAATYRIGSERADAIVRMALAGYAFKDGDHQTAPIIPADNFSEFVDKIAILPYFQEADQETPSPAGAKASPGEAANGVGGVNSEGDQKV